MPEDKFAIKEIRKYYESDSDTRYFKCIEQTILYLENGITDLDDFNGNNELENRIIKTLLTVFLINWNLKIQTLEF